MKFVAGVSVHKPGVGDQVPHQFGRTARWRPIDRPARRRSGGGERAETGRRRRPRRPAPAARPHNRHSGDRPDVRPANGRAASPGGRLSKRRISSSEGMVPVRASEIRRATARSSAAAAGADPLARSTIARRQHRRGSAVLANRSRIGRRQCPERSRGRRKDAGLEGPQRGGADGKKQQVSCVAWPPRIAAWPLETLVRSLLYSLAARHAWRKCGSTDPACLAHDEPGRRRARSRRRWRRLTRRGARPPA